MDTSVVNRAKLVVSMPGWLTRVCARARRVKQTNIYIYDAHVFFLHPFCFTGTFMHFLSFRRCFVAIMLWSGCAFNPVALLTITPLRDYLN